MPQHITYKLFFSGIDGAGKTACADLLTARLASKYRIVRTGSHDFYLYFNGRKSLVAKRRLFEKSESLRTRMGHLYGIFLMVNFIYKAIKVCQIKLFTKPDLLVYEVDAVLHPAAYITYHLPITRHITRRLRLGILGILFGSRNSSVRIYLNVDPKIAMERINKRGSDGGSHENLKDLTQIKSELDGLVKLAVKDGFDILTIDTNFRSVDEIARDVELMVDRKLTSAAAAQ
jgi:thymidylate kinase